MMLQRRRLGLLCCVPAFGLAALAGPASAASPLRIATSELPPFAMQNPGQQGALFEMVEELVRRSGMRSSIEFVPWRRAIFLSTSRPRSAIFPLTRSPERESQYRWLAPLYREHYLFLSLKGGRFDSARPQRSKQLRIATLRGSLMIKYLRDQGYAHVIEGASVEESMRFLRAGIVEAVCGDRNILRTALGGQFGDNHAVSPTLLETHSWLGGSLDISEADALRFESAMKEMIADGTHARILKKYALGSVHEK